MKNLKQYGDAMRKQVMNEVRKFKKSKPRASTPFAIANSMLIADNKLNDRRAKTGSYAEANDRLRRSVYPWQPKS